MNDYKPGVDYFALWEQDSERIIKEMENEINETLSNDFFGGLLNDMNKKALAEIKAEHNRFKKQLKTLDGNKVNFACYVALKERKKQ